MGTHFFLTAAAGFLATITASCSRIGAGALSSVRHGHLQRAAGGGSHCLLPPTGRKSRVCSRSDPDGSRRLDREIRGRFRRPRLRSAPAGKYAILVQWPDESVSVAKAAEASAKTSAAKAAEKAKARKMKLDHMPSDRLKGRYAVAGQPLLTAEVKAETNNLPPFELQDGAPAAEEKKARRSSVTENRG